MNAAMLRSTSDQCISLQRGLLERVDNHMGRLSDIKERIWEARKAGERARERATHRAEIFETGEFADAFA